MGTTTAYAREGSVEIVHWPSPVRFGTSVELSYFFVFLTITKTAFVMTNRLGQVQLFIAIDMFIIIAIDMIEMTILFSIDMFIIIRIDRWWA